MKYPDIQVQLTGSDGNAMMIIGKVAAELRANKVSADEIKRFSEEAMSGDYNNVMQTCMKWVSVT